MNLNKWIEIGYEQKLIDSTDEFLYLPGKVYHTADILGKDMTFKMLYDEWLVYKSTITDSNNTILRHKQHYKKYFSNNRINEMQLNQIDVIALEEVCNGIVKDFNISRKEWCNVKTILTGMWKYAVRKQYVSRNIVPDIEITVKYRQVVKKTGKTQTYNTTELEDLNEWLDMMYAGTGEPVYMAVRLNFLLGLRVGELVALKWSDVKDNHLHVVCEEVYDQESHVYSVVEHTKVNADRFVVLISKAQEILKMLPKDGEYLFYKYEKRVTARQVAYVLEKYATFKKKNIKRTHKIRKTYASNLSAHNVPIDSIREQLGHFNLSTTLSYIYNPLTDAETCRLIEAALERG